MICPYNQVTYKVIDKEIIGLDTNGRYIKVMQEEPGAVMELGACAREQCMMYIKHGKQSGYCGLVR